MPQTVDSGNAQNQTIIIIKMNLAQQDTIAKLFHLAIITYTEIINDNSYNGCALL